MKELFKDLRKDKILERSFILNSVIVLFSFFYILLYFKNLPPYIPIFNQMPWGEQRIEKTIWIFVIPVITFIILATNLTLSSSFYKRDPLISRLFSITSFLISTLALIFIIRTIHAVY